MLPFLEPVATNFYPRPPRGGRHRCIMGRSRLPDISIHALREEGDLAGFVDLSGYVEFLSTPSARRATRSFELPVKLSNISIHALREEGDDFYPAERTCKSKFLSTPSARRATYDAFN